MHCMKCGKEIADDQVFCEACLEVMAKYPVKPDTPVQIYKRPVRTEKKYARQLTAKEVIQKQARRIRILTWITVILFVAFCLTAVLALKFHSNSNSAPLSAPEQHIPLGQNYIAIEEP